MPAVAGYGAGLAILLGAFNYTGGKLTGYEKDTTVDEVSRKEYLRKNRRRPMEETVQELGEGRGRQSLITARADTSDPADTDKPLQASTPPATQREGRRGSRPLTATTCRSLLSLQARRFSLCNYT